MSENKNGQGAQWSKSAATAAAVTAAAIAAAAQKQQHQQHIQHPTLYNATALGLTSPTAGTSSALYGGSGHLVSHQTSSQISSYAAARFQAPPIDHRSASSSSSHIVPSSPSPSSTTNVPVPSGFIPPPFPPVAGAATSVLTPNPYAVASLTAAGATHSSASSSQSHSLIHPPSNQPFSGLHQIPTSHHHAHFGMEQFQHLNVQQQYELGKLMAASFSTNQQIADSSGPTNLSSNAPSLLSSAQSTSALASTTGSSTCQASTITRNPPPSVLSSTEVTSAGNINSQLADQVVTAISTGSSASKLATTPIHGRLMGLGVHAPDEEKLRRIQQVVESGIGDHAKQQIVQILDRISTLRPVEKLLLYLRLPGEQPETDPLRQPQNPLGTRSEINHTINWVRTHLEQDPQVSIPKQDVYNDYLVYCDRLDIKPLSTADFGKVMKQVFPGIRPRRLGTRGHSRYCYAAMRKTSKLPAPHLPTLSTVKPSKVDCEKDGSIDLSTNIIDNTEEQEESWSVIKQWAETMLHIKIDNITDLAAHIKSNGPLPLPGGTHTPYTGSVRAANSAGSHKKLPQREPKEKRVMVDMGPLKKRRKKKRKGSSSSESSCPQNLNVSDQQQLQPQLSPANSSKSGSIHAVLSPAMDEGQRVKIKQEFLDSPGQPSSVGSLSAHTQSTDSANAAQYQTSAIAATTPKMQHQVMPINLAAETRGGVSKMVSRVPSTTPSYTTSAFEHVRSSGTSTPTATVATAVKNLTPKIMELSVENQAVSSPPPQTIIKQEVGADDYNTSNIFCKKVRKAQQTKGFWANSPTSIRSAAITAPTTSFPIITTTASTPPPTPASVITAPSNTDSVVVYNMGPPTQMAPSTSPNSQSLNDDVNSLGQPKVLSRNLQQLRAKKLLAAAAATSGCDPPDLSAAKDAADLPANLGLPRERVISICNMDKHELDDYFLPVEEENSEDQETELLQYFQMGDAEEKLTKNSSSDAKRNSNSTVNTSTSVTSSTSKLTTTNLTTTSTKVNLTTTTSKISTGTMMSTYKSVNNMPSLNDIIVNSQVQNEKTQQSYTLDYLKSTTITNSLNKLRQTSSSHLANTTTTSSSSCLNTVVTASASLAQLTQKHQQQMQQPQQQLLQNQPHKNQTSPYCSSKVSFKRKINLNPKNTTSEITAARKNYSFLPISPNINPTTTATTTNQTLLSVTYNNSSNCGTGFFASPGLSRLLTKQQSLDSDTTSDPMIGATRRLRSYNSMITSASAPPSPSVLKQQQEQQLVSHMTHHMLLDQWSSHSTGAFNNLSTAPNTAGSMMSDQNSLDLDLFGEAAAAAASAATSTTFSSRNNFNIGLNNASEVVMASNADSLVGQLNDVTQRSQSVPLSQLQRSQSPTFNRSFHCANNKSTTAVSACNSLAQTPVPSEFIDSVTMLSENSCSQQSATIKLEEVANVMASDPTAILDEVDVSEILSSPDFVAGLNQTCTTKTTCSSAGSSSGYSSTGHFSLSSVNYNMGCSGTGNGVLSSSISRSVPSTPLPHQNPQSLFGVGNNFNRRRFINNSQSLNGSVIGAGVLDNLNTFSNSFSSTGKYAYGNISSALSRSACDISKSMPSTPITTTPSSFRYSPSEFTRDFLINGNTIDDSITSSFSAVGGDNLMGSDVVGVDVPLNSESLLNDEDTLINGSAALSQVENDVLTPDFAVHSETSSHGLGGVVGESSVGIGVGSDLLDNL